jgi:transposase
MTCRAAVPASHRNCQNHKTRGAKLHAVTAARGRPVRFFITAGQVSNYTGAAALMNGLPEADWLLADRGYDADWFRERPYRQRNSPLYPWAQLTQDDH